MSKSLPFLRQSFSIGEGYEEEKKAKCVCRIAGRFRQLRSLCLGKARLLKTSR